MPDDHPFGYKTLLPQAVPIAIYHSAIRTRGGDLNPYHIYSSGSLCRPQLAIISTAGYSSLVIVDCGHPSRTKYYLCITILTYGSIGFAAERAHVPVIPVVIPAI